jgi:hypothetical protein
MGGCTVVKVIVFCTLYSALECSARRGAVLLVAWTGGGVMR